MEKTVVFKISPQTSVRATQGDAILFRIPRDKLSEAGRKRVERLEKYNKYKVALLTLAKHQSFDLPMVGATLRFFIPMPRTWRKPKRKLLVNTPHQSKPDLSNLLKAAEDALFAEDKAIAHYSEISKYWVDSPAGWIEVICKDFTPCKIVNPYIQNQLK